jgi:hypothetical protein
MSTSGPPETQQQATPKPPRRHWQASEPFLDFKASHWVEIALTAAVVAVGLLQFGVYTRQAKIMKDQATLATVQTAISNRQADITALSERAFVSAKEIRVDTVRSPVPGQPGQFTDALWFYPVIENGGNIPTKNMRLNVQASVDPSRKDVQLLLPFGFGLGQKQAVDIGHLPDAGPRDPETLLFQDETLRESGNLLNSSEPFLART